MSLQFIHDYMYVYIYIFSYHLINPHVIRCIVSPFVVTFVSMLVQESLSSNAVLVIWHRNIVQSLSNMGYMMFKQTFLLWILHWSHSMISSIHSDNRIFLSLEWTLLPPSLIFFVIYFTFSKLFYVLNVLGNSKKMLRL